MEIEKKTRKNRLFSSIVDWIGSPNHLIDCRILIDWIGLDWIGIPDFSFDMFADRLHLAVRELQNVLWGLERNHYT